jgi:citrate lyase subunit beta / citryl-CoA lyase
MASHFPSMVARVPSDSWTATTAASSRSFLFVPADRPDRVDKALNSAADAVIVDLEDGVGHESKNDARSGLERWASTRPYLLRVNAAGSQFQEGDLEHLPSLHRLVGVVVPKADSVEHVSSIISSAPAHLEIFALIESAAGLLDAALIARSGVARLMFGSADYLADLGVGPSREVLSHARSTLVVASAAAGLPPPVDGPALTLGDPRLVEAESADAKALGLGGKLCIHPEQIDPVNAMFTPSTAELEWAEQVVSQSGDQGAVAVGGQMVDAAVLRRAHRVLSSRDL